MKVPLLDLRRQYARIRPEVEAAIASVVESQQLILGEEVRKFEEKAAAYCGCRYAVGVSSGTDALLVALMALGVRTGDEVVTTPFTFFATAGSIVRLGARPVFIDIEPDTFNLDVSTLEAAVTRNTKAIMPVHLFGQSVKMAALMEIADRYGVPVVEDAAQAIGAECDGKRVGGFGQAGCFSFFPSKNLGAFGDGGLVTTNDEALCRKLRTLRDHGQTERYRYEFIGGNFRLDALQAAVLSVKLPHLDEWTGERQRNAERYDQLFREAGLVRSKRITLPSVVQSRHVFNQYVVRAERRDELREYLAENGVGTAVYYPVPLHLQKCFEDLGYERGSLPQAESAAEEVLALPIFSELTEQEQQYVVECTSKFYQ